MSEKEYLVVGLGNIGPEYARTRHNIGFMVLDAWAQASNAVFKTCRYGDMAEIHIKGRIFYLLKPNTYMNLSGNAVRYWVDMLELAPGHLMVVCDDINLPFGTIRMRPKGSDGGHNGLGNIEETLGTRDYARIRIGIGNDFTQGGQIDFVLGEFGEEQQKELEAIFEKVSGGIRDWALAGIEKAMTALNTKPQSA